MSDQSQTRPMAPGPSGSDVKIGLGTALARASAREREMPSESDHVSARAKKRMTETEQVRYNRHKSFLRGAMMRVFTETMLPENWNDTDDVMMDSLTTWVINLQSRAGTSAEIKASTELAIKDGAKIDIEPGDGKQD